MKTIEQIEIIRLALNSFSNHQGEITVGIGGEMEYEDIVWTDGTKFTKDQYNAKILELEKE